jgi:GNAT superfamily N-acetyltransferase
MNIRFFTTKDYQSIINIHNSLNIVWPEFPQDPKTWVELDRNRNSQCKYQRWIAFDEDKPVGAAAYGQSLEDYPLHKFNIYVKVRPEYQHQGIGSALYDRMFVDLQQFEPKTLRADSFTNLPQGFSFLKNRGFYEAFRETPVHLDIDAFDSSRYSDLERRLMEQGIRIKTRCEMESDPGHNRKFYNLYWDLVEDVPQEEIHIERPDYTEWMVEVDNDPSRLDDAYYFAVHGDEYRGLCEFCAYPSSRTLLGGLMGVRQSERGKGIALAMQVRGNIYARDHGFTMVRSCTAVVNAPMQALFTQLGYVHDPEWLQCQKDIEA